MTPQIDCLGKMTQNMHSQPQVASQHKKTNKLVWTCEDEWPPKRTSSYKRPFTRQGNYLVSKYVYLSIYIIRIAQLQESWLFSFYIVANNKQVEMKLENIQSKLQSSFVLLQFVRLSALRYTTSLFALKYFP